MQRPNFIAIVSTGTMLVLVSVLAYVLPQQSAYGYGYGACLTTPLNMPSGLQLNNDKKHVSWGLEGYGTVPCDDSLETVYRYKVQIKNMSGKLIGSYKNTRSDRFNSPDDSLKLDYKKLNHNQQYKFRVRAIGDQDSQPSWSGYTSFVTKAVKPGMNKYVDLTLGEQVVDTKLWDGVIHWKAISQSDATGFLYYKIVVKEIQNAASGNDSWNKTDSSIIVTTIADVATSELDTDQLFRDFYNTADELPYDEYKYRIRVRAYYQEPTAAEVIVHSDAVTNYFGIIDGAVIKKPQLSQ